MLSQPNQETVRLDFLALTRHEVEDHCEALAVPRVHAESLFRGAYKQLELMPWMRPGLPKVLEARFSAEFAPCLDSMTVIKTLDSGYDGSVKFLVRLSDSAAIECVLMPEARRITLCVSSQVGCAQACSFCHTGRMGLKRNLTAGEIVGQVMVANRWLKDNPSWLAERRLPKGQRISNVVFMGMGEPLDNVVAVAKAMTTMTDPWGLAIALRRISVSTAGHLDGLEELLKIHPKARLAISVHSTDDRERSRIMPINRRFPLAKIFERLRVLVRDQVQPVLLQYTLIRGVNDDLSHAHRLITMTDGLEVKVNLIPFNPVGPSRFEAPSFESVKAFQDVLYQAGIRVMVRYSKGQDIAAACGQLVID